MNEEKIVIHIIGGFTTTSGYSSALRGFAEALNERDDVELYITDVPNSIDKPIPKEDMISTPLSKVPSYPPEGIEQVDIELIWGVPDLRRGYKKRNNVKQSHHMVSWECDVIPRLWGVYLESADTVITPSDHSFKSMTFEIMGELIRIPHGFDPNRFYKKNIKEDDVFRVLYVGTWIARKAPIETIVNAAIGLVNKNAEILVKVDYDRNTISKIMTSIQSNLMKVKLPKNHKFPKITILNGTYNDEEMNDLYNIADVVILTSRGEAWGLPLMNAIATKTPIITTDKGGQMDYIKDDYKFLIPSGEFVLANDRGLYSIEHGVRWFNPDFTKIAPLVKELHDMSNKDREELGEELYNHLIDNKFMWDDVVETYLKLVRY